MPAPSSPTPRPPHGRAHARALVLAVVVTVLWSSSWVLIRIGLRDAALPPITFAGLRYALAAAVVWSWVLPNHRTAVARLGRADLPRLALLGVVFYAVTQGAQFVAIDAQPAATTSLVLAVTPLAVALASGRTISERAAGRQLTGAMLVALGAFAYFAGGLGATWVGMTAAVIGLGANVAASLLGRTINRDARQPAVVVTAVSMSIGAALLLVAGVVVEPWPQLTPGAVAIIVWLAVVNTALAFTLWNVALRELGAVESAGINNLMLVQIAGLAWIFLDERPDAIGWAGIVVVSIGVFLTQSARALDGTGNVRTRG